MRATRGLPWLNDALGWGGDVWLGPLKRLPLGLRGREGLKGRLLADVGGRSVGIAGVESIGVEGLGGVADSIGCAGVEIFGCWWVVTLRRK